MKHTLLLLSLLISIFTFGQQTQPEKIKINAGLEFRIVPYFFTKTDGAYISNYAYTKNVSKHLSGNSVNVEIEYFFLKSTTIGIAQSFRYDQLYTDLPINNRPDYSVTSPKMRFIADTDIQLKHYFPLKKPNQYIIANLGYSFMNNNTSFTVNEVLERDINGYPIFGRSGEIDWQFQAYKIGIGYKYKKIEATVGAYLAEKHSFEGYTSSGFAVPFLKLNYNITKF
ncbi:hypothetical protein [Kaistella antarctica]|uniref:Outer membrane protein beta-barrel domain-containing protein n=1 Tax=Kaistella antarctica TaxID=266748 RepID=A0A448NRM8_9FLAO|nr:hypothetical protein [Kaistella antarctica]KEY18718.1 hypothetical protein HY04_09565 [Kaistella antarctica]SEW16262.1 hypothetical protein SAMN05421765_2820 [Kaistella antarctica]VEH99659.1 Uncharacterised protein [Kaistella antarctica]